MITLSAAGRGSEIEAGAIQAVLMSANAAKVHQYDRGLLRPGMAADVTVFNAATIVDHPTYEKPHQYATGVDYDWGWTAGNIRERVRERSCTGQGCGRTPCILTTVNLRAIFLVPLLFAWRAAAAPAQHQEAGNEPFPPFRIIGNVYYVGANDIASYLITTPAGHFLLNAGYEDTAPLIRDSIQKLGFHLNDVKILINGQAHFDHVAGQAALQEWTGAKIYSSARDAGVLESGGKTDPRFGKEYIYPAVKVDHSFQDGEKITLADTTLVAHLTPGHTMGCTTWTMAVTDGGKRYDVVFVGGTSINPGVRLVDRPTYPGIADDYVRTFRVLRALKCDVFLGAHGGYYGMIAKRERQKQDPEVNPFIDPKGYQEFIDSAESAYREQLRREHK